MTIKLTPEQREYFKQQGAIGGKKGSKSRWAKMTKEERSEYARNLVKKRWEKKKKDDTIKESGS